MLNISKTAAAAAIVLAATTHAHAATVPAKNVDLMFVVDRSGSMGDEFNTLAENIAVVYDTLNAAPEVNSVGAGLIVYEGNSSTSDAEFLVQEITEDSAAFSASTSDFINNVGTRGGTERALAAIDSAIPGGNSFLNVQWRPNTVRSIVLITDEDADDAFAYSYGGQTGYSALGQYLDDSGYLNNIITTTFLFDDFASIQRPAGTTEDPNRALFDIADFTGNGADPQQFFRDFAAVKLDEIINTNPVGAAIPLPAGLPLLGGALAAFGFAGLRRKARA